jgi:hypothetical protein
MQLLFGVNQPRTVLSYRTCSSPVSLGECSLLGIVSGLLGRFGKNLENLSDLFPFGRSRDLIDFEFLPARLGSGTETVLKCVVFIENSAGQSGGAKPGSSYPVVRFDQCRSGAALNRGTMMRP